MMIAGTSALMFPSNENPPGGYEGRKDRGMKEYKRIKNVSLIWTEEFDIIKEWDDNGHIIKQEIANYQRYRTIS